MLVMNSRCTLTLYTKRRLYSENWLSRAAASDRSQPLTRLLLSGGYWRKQALTITIPGN